MKRRDAFRLLLAFLLSVLSLYREGLSRAKPLILDPSLLFGSVFRQAQKGVQGQRPWSRVHRLETGGTFSVPFWSQKGTPSGEERSRGGPPVLGGEKPTVSPTGLSGATLYIKEAAHPKI